MDGELTWYSPCGYAIPSLFNTASPIPTCPQCHRMDWQSWKPEARSVTPSDGLREAIAIYTNTLRRILLINSGPVELLGSSPACAQARVQTAELCRDALPEYEPRAALAAPAPAVESGSKP